MSFWRIAAAQSGSKSGDTEWNIAHHLAFITQAAALNVDLLLFPELSLTGYDLAHASHQALDIDDPRLSAFSEAAHQHQMSIIIGLPLLHEGKPRLAALAFLPEGTRIAYAKRKLHGDESRFFTPGDGLPLFGYDHRYVTLAVCADITVEDYARDAAQRGANLYAASVLVSKSGYDVDTGYLQRWAQNFNMAVLMANHAFATGGLASAGKSAFWDQHGKQIVVGAEGEQLVIAERDQGHWRGNSIAFIAPAVL
ncbi:carbon-nitrogen hydrolase family protein [Erwinia sp. OLTSP20]|uniref:carbon-nitrogen hydrolase family protein n=1 Tax=unclassified Erwinia TaxID=2622719 RepID=UPI000C1A35BE|nr:MULTISPECIES: carbon-nitrogen hydrolase family protein [unclassified Erwinia]PIJ51445.1 carbon-nitrogen hydrolase family protein [Erwinia sp. OAMSP11]PIJ73467.1 carbon-nitrogen hydrolase family protein [Erwinia sp. OLSSP12]PIJ85530.1 carbon-nitrogen hydrolase family protein [Erwinia sp. OLCASP19]PIJ85928.1 carbon-nitrogen hydrolase family protein [Erwinia sp. OLMTSP26]PIJ87409.1 carbon-nitrogen hydrolase family protein [Erwinia sp. OLMDSP33]